MYWGHSVTKLVARCKVPANEDINKGKMDISQTSSLFEPLRRFSTDKKYQDYFDEQKEKEYLLSCLSQQLDDTTMVFVETFIHSLLSREKKWNINGYIAQVWLGFTRALEFYDFCSMHLLKHNGFYGDDEVYKITVEGFRILASKVRTKRGIQTFGRILELEKCLSAYALDIEDRVQLMTTQLEVARSK